MIFGVVLTIYLLSMVVVGITKVRKVKTEADFAVAGRTLNPWVLVGTMLATWIGTGSIMGNAGKTYEMGIATIILPIGELIGIIVLVKIAAKVRSLNAYTVPEIIGAKYGNAARLLSVIALVLAYLVIVSYQYNAGGAVIQTVWTNASGQPLLDSTTAVIIAAVFIVAYTMLAGLVSVAYTDMVTGIIILLSLAIIFPILWVKAGGLGGIQNSFLGMGKPDHVKLFGIYSWLDWVNFCLPPFLLVLGDANMYQRFSAARNQKSATQATLLLVVGVAVVELLIIGTAWVSSSMIAEPTHGRHVILYGAYHFLPDVLGAILLTTVVGIIISTADSYLLVPATTLVRDVYVKHISPQASQKQIVWVSRLLVLVLGVIAYGVSCGFAKSAGFFERALYAYTIYGTAITPVLLSALFWKWATKEGAVASILAGTLTTLLWKETSWLQSWLPSWAHGFDEVLPAFAISVFCLVVFSYLTTNVAAPKRSDGE